ncbi:transmembrane sensor [Sphingopyxis panaciterrae]|uniref:FecR family protein n=1 Tax=Sphingopyxis panaciterrae TaxID=363841 RepID=UPI00141EEC50|nr:FecR domain-containing protein [Sphingopyxis panaciterrae]NIJ35707.1 transmembrane sensor [Sphingopyxis panaciterrae]
MSIEMQDPIIENAIAWHVRLRDGDDAAWEAFADWMAADPRHAAAYDRVEALDERIDPLLAALGEGQPANDVDPLPLPAPAPRRRFLLWTGGALAASIAAVLTLTPSFTSPRYEVATAAGERRQVQLDEGTDIALNGATKLLLDRDNPRAAALVEGQALFRVRHDDERPFVLAVGEVRIVDLGTIFDVTRERDQIRVAVSEGKVEYRAAGKTVALVAGQSLVATNGGDVTVSDTPVEAVGSWQNRRYLYSGAPLSRVAADLSRAQGIAIRVDPALAGRLFSGNVQIEGSGEAELRRLAIALDVKLERSGQGWVMGPSRSAPN